jgi:protein-S-isoprenylcysteine O-methyltransferase Ste14
MSNASEKIRHVLEALVAALLFGTQTILNAGIFISVMSIPLLPYLYSFLVGEVPLSALQWNIHVMLFSKMFWVGRIVAIVGLVLLVVSAAQLVWNLHKGAKTIQTGLYARMRHPQFTGIMIVAAGCTIMVLTNDLNGQLRLAELWLIQAFGYIALALFEEWRLTKKHGEAYRQYKRKVPFLFPIKAPSWLPEILLTLLITVLGKRDSGSVPL